VKRVGLDALELYYMYNVVSLAHHWRHCPGCTTVPHPPRARPVDWINANPRYRRRYPGQE